MRTLRTRLETINNNAQALKTYAGQVSTLLDSPIPVATLVRIHDQLKKTVAVAVAEEGKDDIEAYAKAEFSDPDFSIQAVIAGVKALLTQAIAATKSLIPLDGSGHVLSHTWGPSDAPADVLIGTTLTGNLKNLMDTISNAIPAAS